MSICDIYMHTTTFYATASYPVFTTSEIPANVLFGQKTAKVTIFWPLSRKIKPIKCMKLYDDICVMFFTILHNGNR